MKISALTILKNAVEYDYPFLESIRSALPLCHEYVVVAGKSSDETLSKLREIDDPRLRIVESEWSPRTKPEMCVLSQQTNIGLHLCTGDWVLYLQANEVLHEDALAPLEALMARHVDNDAVEALLLERLSFWGDYDHMLRVYPHRFKFSPRIVRPYIGTYSIRDAMSFAVFDGFSTRGRNPRAVDSGQNVFRYSSVMSAKALQHKVKTCAHLRWMNKDLPDDLLYTSIPRQFVQPYTGSHPGVMSERIHRFEHKLSTDDPRWRATLSLSERKRILETWWYERYGVPALRRTRYTLAGGYQPKKRPY